LRTALFVVSLVVVGSVLLWRGGVFVRLRDAAKDAPGLIPAFGGVALGFTLTLRPFADPLFHAVLPHTDLRVLFAAVGFGAVVWMISTEGARRRPAWERATLLAIALLLFALPRIADAVNQGSWLDRVARRDAGWLLAGALLIPLVPLAVGWKRLARSDGPGLVLAAAALAAAYTVRLEVDPGPLVARGANVLGVAALLVTIRWGTAELAVGAALAARLAPARTRAGLAWTAVGLLAIRTAAFHAMGGTESFATVDVAAGFVGMRAAPPVNALTEGGGGVTGPIIEAGLQLAFRFSLPWLLLLAAAARVFGTRGGVRRLVGDVALTFAARAAAITVALWAWWRSAWWMERAYPVFALGAADVVLLLTAALLIGAFSRNPGGPREAEVPSAGPTR
jgi:hypothetical protein